MKLIREHLGALAGKRVLDVGCGKGRFARVFRDQEPHAEIWGLDISEEMLRYVPAGIQTRAGSMTEMPFEDGFFDAAYATESLEHAVEIERAVSEICRVVKPGGRIAIIDKNADAMGHGWKRPNGSDGSPARTGTPARAPLPRGFQPVHFLLGRRGAGRAVSGLAGGEVAWPRQQIGKSEWLYQNFTPKYNKPPKILESTLRYSPPRRSGRYRIPARKNVFRACCISCVFDPSS